MASEHPGPTGSSIIFILYSVVVPYN